MPVLVKNIFNEKEKLCLTVDDIEIGRVYLVRVRKNANSAPYTPVTFSTRTIDFSGRLKLECATVRGGITVSVFVTERGNEFALADSRGHSTMKELPRNWITNEMKKAKKELEKANQEIEFLSALDVLVSGEPE